MPQGGQSLPEHGGQADDASIDRVLRNVSILVVDDEPGMRNFLLRTLGPRCKRIEAVASAEEASRALDAKHFDLVVLDNVMPGQSGLDWLTEQRKVGFFADAILMTAYADLETAIQALRVGASDFVLKPFRSNQIINAVARCSDQRLLKRENFLLKYELRAALATARGRFMGNSPRIEARARGARARGPAADAGASDRRKRNGQGNRRPHLAQSLEPRRQTLRGGQLRADIARQSCP